jgi:hypothetical protein
MRTPVDNGWLGREHTDEAKAKMSAARTGSTHTKETKAKLSKIQNEQYVEILKAGERKCVRCGDIKLLTDFPAGRRRRDGTPRYAYCKKCHSSYQRTQKLRNFFLMTVEDADKIFAYQGNLCAICRRPAMGGTRLALDHRHRDGLVRGGLCNWCNRAIARFNDDIVRLRAAADYLESPPAVRALGHEHFARPGRIGTKKQRAIIRREKKQRATVLTLLMEPHDNDN